MITAVTFVNIDHHRVTNVCVMSTFKICSLTTKSLNLKNKKKEEEVSNHITHKTWHTAGTGSFY